MQVRPKKAAPSQKGPQPTAKMPANPFTFPAPTRGWILNENLAQLQPAGARILDNWYCTTTGAKVRGGRTKFATLDSAVISVFTYQVGLVGKLFAATATKVYDVTSPASPTTVPSAAITGQTSGYYSTCMFGTAGGNFLVIANGTDAVQNYNGTAWSVPTITGVSSAALSQVWAHGEKLFFIEKNTLRAWYLPTSSIAGAANTVSLAGVMTRGGYLVFGGKWSLDAGNGLDDKCVFVSSEGEVAIYQGTDPSTAATWSLVGVYLLPKPMGKNGHISAGGDLLIATETGLIPISASINRDIAAMDQAAVSRPIAPYWHKAATRLAGTSWEMVKVPELGIMLISQPDVSTATTLIVNLQTGAWSRFTGWDTQCLAYFSGFAYCGSLDASIYLLNNGGSDNGTPYTALFLGQADAMGAYGQQKTVLQMRPVFSAASPMAPQLRALVDYSEAVSSPPNSPMTYSADAWDSGLWDVTQWDTVSQTSVSARWTAIGVTGRVIAPELQLTFGVTSTPNIELVAIDAQFRAGAVVT